jgi:hypothetical protein
MFNSAFLAELDLEINDLLLEFLQPHVQWFGAQRVALAER